MYVLIHANDGIIFRSDKHFCWMDGYAALRKGELLSGRLGKTIVYIHTNIHTYIHTYVRTYMCKHVFIFVYIKLHCVMYIHTYTFEDACTNIRSYVHTYKHTNILVFILGKKTLGGDMKCGLFNVVNIALNVIFVFRIANIYLFAGDSRLWSQ